VSYTGELSIFASFVADPDSDYTTGQEPLSNGEVTRTGAAPVIHTAAIAAMTWTINIAPVAMAGTRIRGERL